MFSPHRRNLISNLSSFTRRILSSSASPLPSPAPSPSPILPSSSPSLSPSASLRPIPSLDTPPNPLIDSFNRTHTYLRISLTEKCNLRCVYCMPDTTSTPAPPTNCSTSEFLRLSNLFVTRLGINKVRLTGGEPLIHPDIINITREISSLEGSPRVTMTTNGLTLSRNLTKLLDSGLSSVNISLDTLEEAKFEILTKRRGYQKIINTIHETISTGMPVKVNMVVMNGINENEIVNFVKLTENFENLKVRFIEYMPFDGNKWSHGKFISYESMLQLISRHYSDRFKLLPIQKPGDTTKYYQVDGYKGQVGFITSMTNHFCSGCNRLRITADGNLKVCLFGNDETSLRDIMRDGGNDHDLEIAIRQSLMKKYFSLGGNKDMFDISKSQNRSMVRIGG